MTRALLVFMLACAAAAPPAEAASFNCARAATAVERAICASPELSELDELAAHYYAEARRTVAAADATAPACLLADQRAWLAVRNRCTDDACLKRSYLDRLSELDKLQPARRVGEPMALPPRPFLITIIGPTDQRPDAVESDPARAARLDVTGTLSDDEGAFVLTVPGGRRYALMNWYLQQAVLDRLHDVIATPGTRIKLRGFAGRNRASGRDYVEPRRCIYLYQLP
jgi:uncharacterized protein